MLRTATVLTPVASSGPYIDTAVPFHFTGSATASAGPGGAYTILTTHAVGEGGTWHIGPLTPGVSQNVVVHAGNGTSIFRAAVTGGSATSASHNIMSGASVNTTLNFIPNTTFVDIEIADNSPFGGTNSVQIFGFTIDTVTYIPQTVVATITSGDDYHYGFNGQMKVNQIAGVGNHNTALYWEYDTRTGRRWNLDPVPKSGISIYSAFNDNPILYNDILGDDTGRVVISEKIWKNVYKTHLDGIKKNPQLVSPNGKIYLSYDPNRSNARKRRREARGDNPTIPEQNLDEFPYASTREGGRNAAVNYVPETENKEHGGYIGSVVLRDKMKDGDLFEITLVPDNDQKKKVPQLNPLIVPSFKPRPHMGYPGQGVGDLISKGIEYLTGKRIWIPDPVIAPVPAPIPAL